MGIAWISFQDSQAKRVKDQKSGSFTRLIGREGTVQTADTEEDSQKHSIQEMGPIRDEVLAKQYLKSKYCGVCVYVCVYGMGRECVARPPQVGRSG